MLRSILFFLSPHFLSISVIYGIQPLMISPTQCCFLMNDKTMKQFVPRCKGSSKHILNSYGHEHANLSSSSNGKIPVCQEMAFMSWMEVECWTQKQNSENEIKVAVLPIGATEQHGPTGLTGTDFQTAESIARGACVATGSLLLPTLSYGMSMHHTSFPGTVSVSPSTYASMIEDIIKSMKASGFSHILLLNGHGGNILPAKLAISNFDKVKDSAEDSTDSKSSNEKILKNFPEVLLHNWYSGKRVSSLAKQFYGNNIGQHATPDEVAITQFLFPASAKSFPLDDNAIEVARKLGGRTNRISHPSGSFSLSHMCPQDFRNRFPDGRMGSSPNLATPQDGQKLYEAAVLDTVQLIEDWINGNNL